MEILRTRGSKIPPSGQRIALAHLEVHAKLQTIPSELVDSANNLTVVEVSRKAV